MMLYPAINELNKLTDSRYTLVVLTARELEISLTASGSYRC